MQVLLLNGSPKKKGNTGQVLGQVSDELTTLGHQSALHHIVDYEIQGCTGCFSCQKTNDYPGCVIKDDQPKIRDLMLNSDAVLIGSPLYMWGFTAQLKALFDRNLCLVNRYHQAEHSSLLEDKPFALLLSAGGPVKDNAEGALSAYERICAHIKVNNLGAFTMPGCSAFGELPPSSTGLAEEIATKLASTNP